MDRASNPQPDADDVRPPRERWVLIAFIAIAAYFLITEHKAHLSGLLYYLPFLLLLACPLIHIFMHRGHGGKGGHDHRPPREGSGP